LTDTQIVRERHVWIAVTAVLATSLVWLATASLVLLASTHLTRFPQVLAVLRALSHAALAVGHLGGPAAPAALAGAVILLGVALQPGRHTERRSRHA
jgi:hypothetical protein